MRFVVQAVLSLLAAISSAAEVRTVWTPADVTSPGRFPYRVIQRTPIEVQMVNAGQPGLCVLASDLQDAVLGEIHFTLSGRMGLVVPGRGARHVRPFDPDRGRFVGDERFTFETRFARWVVGERHIAFFEQIGQEHVTFAPQKVELVILSHADSGLTAFEAWESTQFTDVRAMDVNAAGDVAALVTDKATGALAPASKTVRCHLVLVRESRSKSYLIEDGFNEEAAVALAPNSASVAIAIGSRVAIYRVADELEPIAEISLPGCVATGRVVQLALSDADWIGVWMIAFDGDVLPGHWQVIAARADGRCSNLGRYDFNAVRNPLIRFVTSSHVYVTAQQFAPEPVPIAAVFELD